MQVQNKRAIITGAGSGIGAATARMLSENGASVLVTDVNAQSGQAVAEAITEAGGKAIFHPLNVSDERQWTDAIRVVEERWGGLDILVNNAGISMFALVTDLTIEQWRQCMSIDLDGVFLGTKHAIPLMRRGGGGSIVNMSSMAGITGQPNLSAYCAAKGGVRMFTKAVALETATDGIRVNSIHPGLIDTPIFDTVSSDAAVRLGTVGEGTSIDLKALAKAITPLGHPGSPEDVARAVLFLASDNSSYITGTELIIDGGITAA